MAQIRQALAPTDRRERRGTALSLALLAEAYVQGDRPRKGWRCWPRRWRAATSGVRYWEAELHRLKGELLLQRSGGNAQQAEACFQQALAVARRQQAKSWSCAPP